MTMTNLNNRISKSHHSPKYNLKNNNQNLLQGLKHLQNQSLKLQLVIMQIQRISLMILHLRLQTYKKVLV